MIRSISNVRWPVHRKHQRHPGRSSCQQHLPSFRQGDIDITDGSSNRSRDPLGYLRHRQGFRASHVVASALMPSVAQQCIRDFRDVLNIDRM